MIILLCVSSSSLLAKDLIPIGIAVAVFILNVIYQEYNRRNNISDKISSEVVSTCDKMTRYAIEIEYSALAWQYWKKMKHFFPYSRDENKETYKESAAETTYYHRKSEDAGLKLDLLKSELKKNTKDLLKYWPHELQSRQIIALMSTAVLIEPRRFEGIFDDLNINEMQTEYTNLTANVQNETIFNGIGFELVSIQKLIDPKSPTLFLNYEDEQKLIAKIQIENKYS